MIRFLFPRLYAARRELVVLRVENETLRLALVWREAQLKARAQLRIDATNLLLVERVVVAKHELDKAGAL